MPHINPSLIPYTNPPQYQESLYIISCKISSPLTSTLSSSCTPPLSALYEECEGNGAHISLAMRYPLVGTAVGKVGRSVRPRFVYNGTMDLSHLIKETKIQSPASEYPFSPQRRIYSVRASIYHYHLRHSNPRQKSSFTLPTWTIVSASDRLAAAMYS